MGWIDPMDLQYLNNIYFLLLSYSILGAGLKYIDDAFDEKSFSKKKGVLLAPLLGCLWAITMLLNPYSATLLLAIVLGVLLKGKIDNIAHLLGLVSILVIIIIVRVELLFLPLVFLTAAGVIDEVGNDILGSNPSSNPSEKKFRYRFASYFFGRRYILKVALLYLILVGCFPMEFLLALIFFDEAYLVID